MPAPELTAIAALMTSIKHAFDLTRIIKDTGYALSEAERRLQTAELIEALAGVKTQAADVQDTVREKDQRIRELEDALKLKAVLVRKGDAYFQSDESGKTIGHPYCTHCWDARRVGISLHRNDDYDWQCANCKTTYNRRCIPFDAE